MKFTLILASLFALSFATTNSSLSTESSNNDGTSTNTTSTATSTATTDGKTTGPRHKGVCLNSDLNGDGVDEDLDCDGKVDIPQSCCLFLTMNSTQGYTCSPIAFSREVGLEDYPSAVLCTVWEHKTDSAKWEKFLKTDGTPLTKTITCKSEPTFTMKAEKIIGCRVAKNDQTLSADSSDNGSRNGNSKENGGSNDGTGSSTRNSLETGNESKGKATTTTESATASTSAT